jgi:hypothetical protein
MFPPYVLQDRRPKNAYDYIPDDRASGHDPLDVFSLTQSLVLSCIECACVWILFCRNGKWRVGLAMFTTQFMVSDKVS